MTRIILVPALASLLVLAACSNDDKFLTASAIESQLPEEVKRKLIIDIAPQHILEVKNMLAAKLRSAAEKKQPLDREKIILAESMLNTMKGLLILRRPGLEVYAAAKRAIREAGDVPEDTADPNFDIDLERLLEEFYARDLVK